MQLSRRSVLFSTTAVAVAGLLPSSCSSSDTTVQGIIDTIKTTCHFTTSVEPIVQVILTLVTSFNAAAGAGAMVAAAVAKQVVDMVCNAVQAQVAQMNLQGASGGATEITVAVNGVKVPGKYQP